MKRSLVALFALGACVAVSQTASAESNLDNCYVVRGTADARNPTISRERAERRLHDHVAREMRSIGGHSVGPTNIHCIRNACEASAIVCRH